MEKILQYLNNYFYKFKEENVYKIVDKTIEVKGTYLEGQYIRLEGSVLNDKVYKVTNVEGDKITLESGVNEEFKGTIYSLAIPIVLTELETSIKEYQVNNKPSSIQSESFGNYSYSKTTNKSGNSATWKDIFAEELKPYRKMIDNKRGVKTI